LACPRNTTTVRKHQLLGEQVRNIILIDACIKILGIFCKQFRQRDFLERGDADDLEDFMQTWLQFQSFLQYSDKQISAYRGPELDTHRVRRVAQKVVNTKMLFDPAKEQFYLPAGSVELSNLPGRSGEQIGQKYQWEILQRIAITHSTQRVGIALLAAAATQSDGLIATESAGEIDWATAHDIVVETRLWPG